MVLEVHRPVPVGVQRHQLAGRVLQPGGGDGLLRDFVHTGEEVLQHGEAIRPGLDLVHAVAVRRPDGEDGVLDGTAIVRVIFIDIQIGPLVVFQHDRTGPPGKQLHMVLFRAQNVVVQRGGLHQGVHPRLQALPQDLAAGRGGLVQVVGAVLDLGQPEGNALHRGTV